MAWDRMFDWFTPLNRVNPKDGCIGKALIEFMGRCVEVPFSDPFEVFMVVCACGGVRNVIDRHDQQRPSRLNQESG